MSRRMKLLSIAGGVYCVYAIAAFMAAAKADTPGTVNKPTILATTSTKTSVGSERFSRFEKGAQNYFLSVYVTEGCHWCVKQEAELESLRAMGYHTQVIQGKKGIRSFPYTIITYGSFEGDIVYAITGYRSAYRIDLLLSSNPKPRASNPSNLFLTIWMRRTDTRMLREIPKLEQLGYYVVTRRPPTTRFVKSLPLIVVNRDRLNGPRVRVIHGFHTAEEIDALLRGK